MCNCLFCGEEMEAEENIDNPHVCPPDKNISLQSVRVAMNEIFDEEDDGWEAWAQLVEWLNEQSAQPSVEPTFDMSPVFVPKPCAQCGQMVCNH